MNNRLYVVMLDCNHELRFKMSHLPKKSDHLWCIKCARLRIVTRAEIEVSVVCQDCTFARYYGLGDQNGRRVAQAHAAKFDHWLKWTTKDDVTEIRPIRTIALFDEAS